MTFAGSPETQSYALRVLLDESGLARVADVVEECVEVVDATKVELIATVVDLPGFMTNHLGDSK